jgi:hypothetical protein
MVSATESPATLRVSFTYDTGLTSQFEVVCFVRPCFEGLDILYSHHLQRFRSVPRGPWQDEASMVMQLTPNLIGLIQQGVMLELFSKFGSRVRNVDEVAPDTSRSGDTAAKIAEIEGKRKKI